MSSKKKPEISEKEDIAHAKLQQLAEDTSTGEAPAVLREVARLQIENAHLKKRNLRIWLTNGLMTLGLVTTVSGVLYGFPKYRYVATSDNQAICQVTTQSTPRVSAADVTNFAKDAVLNSYSYDYVNYRSLINEAASRWYTQDGHRAFMQGLDSSGNLERVIKGRLILRSMATRTPQLEEISPAIGTPQEWTVIVPIAIEFFQGGAETPLSRQEFRASVKVLRTQASANNLKGILVDSVVLMPPRG